MNRARLSVLSATVLIAACSSGSDEFSNGGPAAGTFDITVANGPTAARVAWESAVASGDFADLGGNLFLTTAIPGGFSKPTLAQPAGFLANVMQKIPFGPEVSDCLMSGTVTISGDIADPITPTLTTGDTFNVESDMCDDGVGEVVDGLIEFTVGDFSGDFVAGTFLLSMDAVVTNLQVTTATDTSTSNGDTTVSLDTSATPFVDAGTSGTSMTSDSNSSSATITNFQSNQTVDGNLQNLPFTMSASGTLNSTQLSGIVNYSTPTEFSGEGFSFPSAGVLLVEGASSSARLIAVDDVNVAIEIDINGDGVTDDTINTTWVALTS